MAIPIHNIRIKDLMQLQATLDRTAASSIEITVLNGAINKMSSYLDGVVADGEFDAYVELFTTLDFDRNTPYYELSSDQKKVVVYEQAEAYFALAIFIPELKKILRDNVLVDRISIGDGVILPSDIDQIDKYISLYESKAERIINNFVGSTGTLRVVII